MTAGPIPPPFEEDEDDLLPRGLGTEAHDLPLDQQVALLRSDYSSTRRIVRTLWRWRNYHNRVHLGHDEWAGNRAEELRQVRGSIFGNPADPSQPGIFTRIAEMEQSINRRLRNQTAQNWAILLALLALIGSLVAVLATKG